MLRIRTYSISMSDVLGPTQFEFTQLKLASIALVICILPDAMSFAAFFCVFCWLREDRPAPNWANKSDRPTLTGGRDVKGAIREPYERSLSMYPAPGGGLVAKLFRHPTVSSMSLDLQILVSVVSNP
jgi:hypothetical protein